MSMSAIRDEVRDSWLSAIFNNKILAIAFVALLLIVLLPLSGMIFETNPAGFYSVKQAAVSGKMTAYNTPGMFWQMFGDVTKYRQSDVIYFSKHAEEGKEADESVQVRFTDGAMAKVTGNVRIDLPADPQKLLEIHQKFRSYDALVKDTVKQIVNESVILTAALMSAEESYTTKRAEFSQLADDQVKNGVFLTEADTIETKDYKTGEITKKQVVKVQRDGTGLPERKDSVLNKYGIRVSQFVIKEIDYEDNVNQQINTKQQALMKTVAAKAEAEKAQQDRITAEEVGKKNVSVAKYEKEVEKAQAITTAEKDLEVAKLGKQAAEQNKQIQILKADGEAEYRRRIMQADGALEKKLQAYVETQKVWAEAMAKMTQPIVPGVIMGGNGTGSSNGALNLMEIMAIKAAKDLQLDVKASK